MRAAENSMGRQEHENQSKDTDKLISKAYRAGWEEKLKLVKIFACKKASVREGFFVYDFLLSKSLRAHKFDLC